MDGGVYWGFLCCHLGQKAYSGLPYLPTQRPIGSKTAREELVRQEGKTQERKRKNRT